MNSNKEVRGNLTMTGLIRWAGLFAILAGILYIGIQLIHPSDNISSVNSSSWLIVACLTSVMSLCSLIGVVGIYARQVEKAGWLGLVGFVIFSLFWLISIVFSFIEAFILPLLTNDFPKFVEGFIGILGGTESEVNLGFFPTLAPISGIMYVLGGLLLGIATARAQVLPRFAAILLAVASVVTLTAAVIPHPFDRVLAVPMGVALIWLGYALWSERGRSNGM
ncbi:hypothetical protein CD798_05105 [Bacillaceae bacterium SAOS 7]|nr:hypothetical protein CD798_05105 [Bacillaceae bacterium SAOS 7]